MAMHKKPPGIHIVPRKDGKVEVQGPSGETLGEFQSQSYAALFKEAIESVVGRNVTASREEGDLAAA